jgi:hypothetical protein
MPSGAQQKMPGALRAIRTADRSGAGEGGGSRAPASPDIAPAETLSQYVSTAPAATLGDNARIALTAIPCDHSLDQFRRNNLVSRNNQEKD